MAATEWKVKALELESNGSLPKNGVDQMSGPVDDDGREARRGTVWTASAHVITAVIGSGVLSLAWSISQLGWIAGPISLLFFSLVTYYTSTMLAECYRFPDPVTGERNYSYMDAVKSHLGGASVALCGLVQYGNLVGTTIGYTITSSISMVAIKRSDCFHVHGHKTPCHVNSNTFIVIFGFLQILFSQIPNFDRIWWLSYVAAAMSFAYASVGLGLSLDRAIENHEVHGSISGVSNVTDAQKAWRVFQALGNIAFAYSFSNILIEIQDTLKSRPSEEKVMKRAAGIGIVVTTVFYMAVGCVGYAAFGDDAPGNLLTGFGFYDPYWLVDLANICIVVHLVGAYQVFVQPIFAFVEHYLSRKFPRSNFVNEDHCFRIPGLGKFTVNWLRLVWRTLYVLVITLVSMLVPFFNDILGLLGAFGFWPLTVYFPVKMYLVKHQLRRWSPKWLWLHGLSFFSLFVSIAAGIGSVEGLTRDVTKLKPFHAGY